MSLETALPPAAIGNRQKTRPGERVEALDVVCWSAPTVHENLAVDAWLAQTMRTHGRRILRYWWGGPPAVVMGQGECQDQVIDSLACRSRGVEIVRRITGGGTVLQTRQVFNYSIVMPDPGFLDLQRGFHQGTSLIVAMLSACGLDGRCVGTSDVAVGDRKVSGNAQARRWRALLVHGSLLVDFDHALAEAVLYHPEREPAYRCRRSHREFLVTLAELGVQMPPEMMVGIAVKAARQVFESAVIQERTGQWLRYQLRSKQPA